jgi:hypothetical protein
MDAMRTVADLNEEMALQDQARAFVVASLLNDSLKVLDGEPTLLANFAQSRGIPKSVFALATKAATAAGTTTDGSWAGPLAPASSAARALLGYAERFAVLPRLHAVRVDGAVTGAVQVGNATSSWIGEAGAKPIRALAFNAATMRPLTLTVNVVMSDEFVTLGAPGSLSLVERALAVSLTSALDTALLDPASTAISGVRPASLTAGLSPIAAGVDLADSIGAALGALSDGAASRPVIVVNAQTLVRLTGLRDLADAGVRVLASPAVPATRVVAIDSDGVLFSDDGIELRRGRPDVQMDDSPAEPTTSTTVLVSSWQRGLSALKALRHANWTARPGAVVVVDLV